MNRGEWRDGQRAATQFCVGLSRVRGYLEFEYTTEGSKAVGKWDGGKTKSREASLAEPEVEEASR